MRLGSRSKVFELLYNGGGGRHHSNNASCNRERVHDDAREQTGGSGYRYDLGNVGNRFLELEAYAGLSHSAKHRGRDVIWPRPIRGRQRAYLSLIT